MPHRRIAPHYNCLARRYDRRWRSYLDRTLGLALEALRLSGTERILDVGCGTGEFARMALARFPHLSIVGVDLAPGMVAVAREKLAGLPQVSFEVATAEALPFAPQTFDVVVCANMLHHVQDPRRVMEECARVLHPGGRMALVDWCADFWHCRLMHYWFALSDRTYTTMYRLGDVSRMMEELGLTIARASRFLAKPLYGMLWMVAERPLGGSG